MKTLNLISKRLSYRWLKILILLQLLATTAFADNHPWFLHKYKNRSNQKPHYGAHSNHSNRPIIGICTGPMITGSQLGPREEINFSVNMNKTTVEIGTFAGHKKNIVSGINFRFKWFATEEDFLNIFFFANMIYDPKAELSALAEKWLYKGISDYTKPIFMTFEEYFGFGLSSKLTRKITLDGSLGFGFYQSKVNNGVILPIDSEGIRDNNGIALSFQIGLIFKL